MRLLNQHANHGVELPARHIGTHGKRADMVGDTVDDLSSVLGGSTRMFSEFWLSILVENPG
jgi:hypothetical protein